MEGNTIKHFIFTRFFPSQNPNYPHDVLDVDFLSSQLSLTKNIFRSLENQTNKNFDLVFILNPKFFDNPKYEFIFSTLRDSTTLPITFIKNSDMSSLVKEALNEYDFVIQSRMDFDDFIFKDAIADTQSKVDECNSVLCYGYCDGYTYFCRELYLFHKRYAGNGHIAILQSLLLKSSFAKNLPSIGIYNLPHTRAKLYLKNFLEKNSMEFSETMFQQNKSTRTYIYFRHDFSRDLFSHLSDPAQFKISDRPPLIVNNIMKERLKSEFGFDGYELKSIK